MHTIVDSIIANSAIWILASLIIIAPIQTEQVSLALEEAYNMSRAANVLREAESLGYIEELARFDGDRASAEKAMSKITSLIPPNYSFSLSWSSRDGSVIGTIGLGNQANLAYVTIIVSTRAQITYLSLGVREG